MVNHGLVTAPLFFIVAALAARAGGSEDLRDMGGIAFRAPVLAVLALIVALATLAMPGSSNFIGEFMILLGVFQAKLAISVIAFAGVVGAAVYALRLFITAIHNRTGPKVRSREIGLGEAAAIVPLVVVILALAFYPQFGLKRSQPTLQTTIAPAQLQAIRAGQGGEPMTLLLAAGPHQGPAHRLDGVLAAAGPRRRRLRGAARRPVPAGGDPREDRPRADAAHVRAVDRGRDLALPPSRIDHLGRAADRRPLARARSCCSRSRASRRC